MTIVERACFAFEIRAGQEQEYQRRHDEIWLEMVEALKASGFSNYTLFRRGTTVYAYVECHPDRDTAFAAMGATDVNKRWQTWFSDVIERISDQNGELFWADEVWHLD